MKRNGGSIVNIIADIWRLMVEMGHLGAARAGMMSLNETGAVEWSPDGMRVNTVAPCWIMSLGFDTYDDPETPIRFRKMPGLVTLETHRHGGGTFGGGRLPLVAGGGLYHRYLYPC